MSVFDFSVPNLQNQNIDLKHYAGNYLLIVNTASQCGFTPQYQGLETLYRELQAQGVVVLGFPCNQFGFQEPGNAEEIASFCTLNYGISFPLFGKLDVNGSDAHPLFEYLKKQAPGILGSTAIKWNFTKFLVGRDGQVLQRFAPQTSIEEIAGVIQSLLNAEKSGPSIY